MMPLGLQPGYVETTAKKITTRIISSNNGKYRYKVDVEWKKMPSIRSYDIIGIGIDTNVIISTGVYFQKNYCLTSGACNSSTVAALKSTRTGGAASFSLPKDSLKSLNAYLYFDISKNTSSAITQLNAYGDYAHATKQISENNAQNYSITRSGIILNDSIKDYYDSISYAKAIWTGNW